MHRMRPAWTRKKTSACSIVVFFVSAAVFLCTDACAFVRSGYSLSAYCAAGLDLSRTFRKVTLAAGVEAMAAEGKDAAKERIQLPSSVRGILFDMDGTLTDSDTLHFEAYRETFLKVTPSFNDGDPITRSYYDDWMSGNSNPAIVEKLFPDMPADEQTALWTSKEDIYRSISTKMTPLPGLLEFIQQCEAAGVAMIVVTNAPRSDATHTLKTLGLYERFGETMVIGYECSRAKPYPDPYLEGLTKLGLAADACVAFEDSVNGVSSAVSANLYTFGVGKDSERKLQSTRVGLCISDYLDDQLGKTIGLDNPVLD